MVAEMGAPAAARSDLKQKLMLRWAGLFAAVLTMGWGAPALADCIGDCTSQLCDRPQRHDDWAVVDATRIEEEDGSMRWMITAVHGGPKAHAMAIGDFVGASQIHTPQSLLVVSQRYGILSEFEVYGEDRVRCRNGLGDATRLAAIDAVLSEDCFPRAVRAGLVAPPCSDTSPESGCSASGGQPLVEAGICLLVGAALFARRR